jgi:transcriptional regulator with XRE-family HTH domain/tetratricopeptide (TPR) repeat protein
MDSGHAFGTLLRRARRAAGLTQEEVAERAGISVRTISNLERGVSHAPHMDTVALLAEALGLEGTDRGAFAAAAGRLRAPAMLAPPGSDATRVAGEHAQSPFVGRQRELALLDRHLAGEGPPVLLLAGEPGIGKTRLLHAAIPRAVALGWRVLEAGCQRRGGQEPYAPLLQAVQRQIRGQRPDELRALLRGCAWLVRLLPELADGPIEPLPTWAVTAEHEHRLMMEAVVRFLTNSAGPAGILLILDDLQWAGLDALDLLARLARGASEISLRVVGAYRDTEMQPSHPLFEVLSDLAHAGLAARHLVGQLAAAESAILLEGLLEADDVAIALRKQVLPRTGGVPFFIISCAQQWRLGTVDADKAVAVPWDITHSVRQRVATLPEGTGEVLGIAALMGRAIEPCTLRVVAAQPEREVLRALDLARRAGLLVEERDAHQFAHDVIREVLEEDLGVARRMALHRRIAETLEHAPGEPSIERLAYHYSRGGEEEKAALYLERAGDRALAQHANDAAEHHFHDLIGRLERLGHTLDAARAYEKLGAVLIIMARYDAALAALDQAAALHRAAQDLESEGRVTARIGWAYGLRGTPEEGLARLQRLLAPLEACGPSPALAALYAALARLYFLGYQPHEALAAASRAVELAGLIGDSRLLAEAMARYGRALLHLGRGDEALRALEEAGALAEAAGDLFTLNRALWFAARVFVEHGELATSMSYLARAHQAGERLGDPTLVASALYARGMHAFYAGDWSQGRIDMEEAVAIGRQLGESWVLVEALLALGELCLYSGDWEEASCSLEEAHATAERRGDLLMLRRARLLLAERDLLQGRPEAARDLLNPFVDKGAPLTDAPRILTLLAWASLDLDDSARAEALVVLSTQRAREESNRLELVQALRVQASVAIRQGCLAAAHDALEEGLSLTRNMPYPHGEARLLQVYALLHRERDEATAARARLDEALAIFQRLGARKDLERVQQDISNLHP